MGLTLGCAQCHDHKYDPLTQRDYYRMFAFFNSIAEEASDRNTQTPGPLVAAPSPEQAKSLAMADRRIAAAESSLTAPLPAVDAQEAIWRASVGEQLAEHWHALVPVAATSSGGATLAIESDGSVLANGENPATDVHEIVLRTDQGPLHGLYLDALVPDGANLPGRAVNQNFVLSEIEVEVTPLGRTVDTSIVRFARAEASWSQDKFDVAAAIDGKPETGWAGLGRDGPRTALFVAEQPFGLAGGNELRVRLRYETGHSQHALARVRFAVSTDPTHVPSSLGVWESAGPFQGKNRTDAFERPLVGEGGATPPAEPITWTQQPGYTDGEIHLFQGDNSAVYLRRTITAHGARTMRVSLGSDDAIRVWLNGEIVLDKNVARPVAADQDTATLTLAPGENELLLKVVNFGGGFGYYFRVVSESSNELPLDLVTALAIGGSTTDIDASVRDFYRRNHSGVWRGLEKKLQTLRDERARIDADVPRTMVSRELEQRRQAHILERGLYDHKGEEVDPGVPAALPQMPTGSPPNRLGLADWLVSAEHPLTARVAVNRYWQRFFGVGLVETAEDFGSQGDFPSHPELLDWLAVEFRESMWDVKAMHRLIVTSDAYRRSSRVDADLLERDPDNRLYARGPRYRLDAEQIRDGALYVSGLLVERIGGKSVRPYQPTGIWKAVGYTGSNTANFRQDQGEALWRRSLYTFWKRTAPPPSMATFDAPSREACTLRRPRTNTPLQALVLLNDPQFVEAMRHFAGRIVSEGGASDSERARTMFRMATSRTPDASELEVLLGILERARAAYAVDTDAARALLAVGDSPPTQGAPPEELAAWTMVASLVLNLDETITKG
ncbi:MAG: DUF1553 domain-containing protein [bacterium]|nr:DUF1553 domain-containing protein [bacterium]